jgi:hypothetical protein
MSIGLTRFLELRGVRTGSTRILFSLVPLSVPVVGHVGLAVAVIYGTLNARVQPIAEIVYTSIPRLPFKPVQVNTNLAFGSGGLYDVLRHSGDVEKRSVAVLATTRMRQKEAVPLLKLAMRDMVDDVRLLAYSIKDNIEGQLNADIKESLSALKYLDGKPASGMERKLAYLYWELVYLELAEGDVLAYLLEQAELYARRYLDALNDASVYLLLGRICLRAGNYDAARTAFEDAKTHGLAASAAAPYKAEAEFCAGNYIDVSRELVHVGEGDRAREPISPVYQYWLGNESTA